MILREHRCDTCAFWRQGAPTSAIAWVNPLAAADIGSCEARPPAIVPTKWFAVSMFPQTHASRGCAEWERVDDDDPGGGESVQPIEGEHNVIQMARAA